MKRFTIELPDEYDDAVTITSIGQTMGVAHVRTNVMVHSADLNGHDGETLVIHPNESPEWRDGEKDQADLDNELKNARWIPCSERLPEDEREVLVWFEYFRYGAYNRLCQEVGISRMFRGEWSGFVNGSIGWQQLRIIAWMPLPEPPEGC